MLHRQHASETSDNCTIDVTPMLDVVFILLIFFIVTASFVRQYGVDIVSPQPSHINAIYRAPLLIEIDARNGLWVEQQAVDVRRIRAYIETAQFLRPGSGVVIASHPQSSTMPLIQVIDASRQARVYDNDLAKWEF